ncbi:MAG TPA: hypothetical protein VGA80_17435 [Flavobacteriaceae bacterium]|jgi:hypothetical protein
MKFIHRLGYYLGGFSVGLIVLAFFLSGKKASCDYGPNARTIKNISSKKIRYSENTKFFIITYRLDSLKVEDLIRTGDIDFSKSKTHLDSCNIYVIESKLKSEDVILSVENCKELATIQSIRLK